MSVTYTKPFGRGHTQEITVEVAPGVVIEHPFDDIRGGDYGRKHRTDDPETLAREIGEDLLGSGWTVQDGAA